MPLPEAITVVLLSVSAYNSGLQSGLAGVNLPHKTMPTLSKSDQVCDSIFLWA